MAKRVRVYLRHRNGIMSVRCFDGKLSEPVEEMLVFLLGPHGCTVELKKGERGAFIIKISPVWDLPEDMLRENVFAAISSAGCIPVEADSHGVPVLRRQRVFRAIRKIPDAHDDQL